MVNRLFRPLVQGSAVAVTMMVVAMAPVHAAVPAATAVQSGVRADTQTLLTNVSCDAGIVPHGYHPPY